MATKDIPEGAYQPDWHAKDNDGRPDDGPAVEQLCLCPGVAYDNRGYVAISFDLGQTWIQIPVKEAVVFANLILEKAKG